MRVYTINPMDDSSVIATVSGSNAVPHEQYNLSGEMVMHRLYLIVLEGRDTSNS